MFTKVEKTDKPCTLNLRKQIYNFYSKSTLKIYQISSSQKCLKYIKIIIPNV